MRELRVLFAGRVCIALIYIWVYIDRLFALFSCFAGRLIGRFRGRIRLIQLRNQYGGTGWNLRQVGFDGMASELGFSLSRISQSRSGHRPSRLSPKDTQEKDGWLRLVDSGPPA